MLTHTLADHDALDAAGVGRGARQRLNPLGGANKPDPKLLTPGSYPADPGCVEGGMIEHS